MNIFRNGDMMYFVERNEAENIDMFLDRGNFIASQKCGEEDLERIIVYSNMYVNSKYLGCVYELVEMEVIDMMVRKCYIS